MKKSTRKYQRYRKYKRRYAKRHAIILAGIAAVAVLITVAIVSSVLLIKHKPQPATPSGPTEIISQPVSKPPINPNMASAATEGNLAYQSLYPELYVPIVEKVPAKEGDKVVYLSYDDGPSELTPQLLDVLY